MAYQILFMVNKARTSNNCIPIFDSYEWWLDLAKNALELADEFEMRLWAGDSADIMAMRH